MVCRDVASNTSAAIRLTKNGSLRNRTQDRLPFVPRRLVRVKKPKLLRDSTLGSRDGPITIGGLRVGLRYLEEVGREVTGVDGACGGAGFGELGEWEEPDEREGRAWANSVGARMAKTKAEPKRVTEKSVGRAMVKIATTLYCLACQSSSSKA